jgi:hypothetical protein
MARRRRRYGSVTEVSLGAFMPDLKANVAIGDVAVGVGAGLVAAQGVKALVAKFAPSLLAQAEGMLGKAMPFATGIAAGAALYYAQKKSDRGYGHAVGAAMAGLAISVSDFLRGQNFLGMTFQEVTQVQLGRYGNYAGLLVPDHTDGRMNGLLVRDNTDARLNELAAMSMGDDDDGIAALVR